MWRGEQQFHAAADFGPRSIPCATRLSCHRFRTNEVRLWLSVIAYNLGNLWRRLVKTGGRLIQHARYYWLLLAESHLTRRLFADLLRKIAALPSPAG